MEQTGIIRHELPRLRAPVLVAGFGGWGNALNISTAMADYLAEKTHAIPFARIDPDAFYRFDEARPSVRVSEHEVKSLSMPGGSFLCADGGEGGDLVILRADEPNLAWNRFVRELLDLCKDLDVATIITIGSMYDNVHHSERILSALASNPIHAEILTEKGVLPVTYEGPGAIHTLIHSEAVKRGFNAASIWCHCPFYLQGTAHFGILMTLADRLRDVTGLSIDTTDLVGRWKEMDQQIRDLIDSSPKLQSVISDLEKEKSDQLRKRMRGRIETNDNVIDIRDMFRP